MNEINTETDRAIVASDVNGSARMGDRADQPDSIAIVPHLTTLQKCLMTAHALLVCLEAKIITMGTVVKRYVGNGSRLIRRLQTWGGKVIKKRGKGSHTKLKMPNGRVETVPKKPRIGTVQDIIKRALEDVAKGS